MIHLPQLNYEAVVNFEEQFAHCERLSVVSVKLDCRMFVGQIPGYIWTDLHFGSAEHYLIRTPIFPVLWVLELRDRRIKSNSVSKFLPTECP